MQTSLIPVFCLVVKSRFFFQQCRFRLVHFGSILEQYRTFWKKEKSPNTCDLRVVQCNKKLTLTVQEKRAEAVAVGIGHDQTVEDMQSLLDQLTIRKSLCFVRLFFTY